MSLTPEAFSEGMRQGIDAWREADGLPPLNRNPIEFVGKFQERQTGRWYNEWKQYCDVVGAVQRTPRP